MKSAAAAAQARLAAGFDQAQRGAEAARGVPSERRGKGVSAQVALARRDSAFRGRQHLGLAEVLTMEMGSARRATPAVAARSWLTSSCAG